MKINIASLLWFLLSTCQATELGLLMENCAPRVHPTTLKALIRTESKGSLYAIADAGPAHLPWRIRKHQVRSFFPKTLEKAEKLADELIGKGHIVAVGLTQISSRNLEKFGFTLKQALDPCVNLYLSEKILANFYKRALKQYKSQDQALLAAISAYNTGNFYDGFSNGYVMSFIAHASEMVGQKKRSLAQFSSSINKPKISRGHKNEKLFEAKLASIEADF
jgi:type IV secretion system protein VirB1